MKQLNHIYRCVIFLLGITLPFYQNLNNWVLGLFYAVSAVYLYFNPNQIKINKSRKNYIFLIAGFFFITLFGMLYSEHLDQALKNLIRVLPMLLTPLAILINKSFYRNFNRFFWQGLVLGCSIAMCICWTNVIYEMVLWNEPFSYLFRHRHTNHQLTDIIGMHASYLSLFVIASVAFLISQFKSLKPQKKKYALALIVMFSFFLFFLLARTLLFFYFVSIFCLIVFNRHWKAMTVVSLVIIALTFVVINVKDEYGFMYKKFYSQLPLIGKEGSQDSRFKRLMCTKNMFLKHPFIGVGTADSRSIRAQCYMEIGDERAFNNRFNAHNQFFEYLDEFGLVGGSMYILVFVVAFRQSYKHKDWFFLYITLLFFVANLTESMLQRTHGVVFYSVIFSLMYSKYVSFNEEDSLANNELA